MKKQDQHINTEFKVDRYSSSFKKEWNDFVNKSKNATFLFHRDFMDYHQDRFEDFSLMVFKGDKLMALLPANKVANKLHSHQGLSYGSLILQKKIKFKDVLHCLQSILQYLCDNNIVELSIKLIPKIYHHLPSDEMDYLLFILRGTIQKKETLSVVYQDERINLSKDRKNGVKRGGKNRLLIREENKFGIFWNSILSKNLMEKYNVLPVHSLEEIVALKENFPKNIRQFNVYQENRLVAGTTIFESKQVAHCQYISANEDKNTLGSLDFLHDYLINSVFKNKMYYDFGSSNEEDGLRINEGLQYWKEGFGSRVVIQESYNILTENHKFLNDVLK